MPYNNADIEFEQSVWVQIKREVKKSDLRRGAYPFFALISLGSAAGIIVCAYILATISLPGAVLLLLAVVSAFLVLQLGYLGHAAGHRQVANRPWVNDVIALVFTPLVGISQSMWRTEHNKHHAFPNDTAIDLAPRLPLFSFSKEQFLARHPVIQKITRFQAFYFLPVAPFEPWGLHVTSFLHLWKNRKKFFIKVEAVAVIFYWLLCGAFLAFFLVPALGIWGAVGLYVLHKYILGFLMGMAFAPNHKGMELIEASAEVSFLARQLRTTRNTGFGGWIITIWYGGLNYQIEHHLFPDVPYIRLDIVRKVVKRRLGLLQKGYNLPYHEVSTYCSYAELLAHLADVAKTRLATEVA